MVAKSIIKTTIIFVAGVAAGWWFATHRAEIPQTVVTTPNPRLEAAPTKTPSAARAAIWITVEHVSHSMRVPGVVLDQYNVIVAALYSAYPASSIYYDDPITDTSINLNIIAADEKSGLIAFEYNQPSHPALAVSSEDGSLFLGKEIALQLPQSKTAGHVDSALTIDPLERESYAIQFISPPNVTSGAIVDIDSGKLIGYMPTTPLGGSNTRAYAVDAAQIRALLSTSFSKPLDISSFNGVWAQSSGGLSLELRRLTSADDWLSALPIARRLWQSNQNSAEDHSALFSSTALFAAQQLLENNNTQDALNILNEMQQTFGDVQPWCILKTQASIMQRRWNQALSQIEACMIRDTSAYHGMRLNSQSARTRAQSIEQQTTDKALFDTARSIALSAYQDQSLTIDQQQSLLSRANSLNQDAQLFRLLGDIEYDASRYANAMFYYRQAIGLDSSLAAILANRMQNSDQRTQTVPSTEVSFEKRRGALVVTGYLNNSSQPFRFLVDTGATYSAVSTATILKLGLSDVFAYGAPLIELESAAGPIYVQKFTLDSMRIGSAQIDHVPVVILEDLDGFDGLVGLSYLQHFDVTLDQQAGKLILTRR